MKFCHGLCLPVMFLFWQLIRAEGIDEEFASKLGRKLEEKFYTSGIQIIIVNPAPCNNKTKMAVTILGNTDENQSGKDVSINEPDTSVELSEISNTNNQTANHLPRGDQKMKTSSRSLIRTQHSHTSSDNNRIQQQNPENAMSPIEEIPLFEQQNPEYMPPSREQTLLMQQQSQLSPRMQYTEVDSISPPIDEDFQPEQQSELTEIGNNNWYQHSRDENMMYQIQPSISPDQYSEMFPVQEFQGPTAGNTPFQQEPSNPPQNQLIDYLWELRRLNNVQKIAETFIQEGIANDPQQLCYMIMQLNMHTDDNLLIQLMLAMRFDQDIPLLTQTLYCLNITQEPVAFSRLLTEMNIAEDYGQVAQILRDTPSAYDPEYLAIFLQNIGYAYNKEVLFEVIEILDLSSNLQFLTDFLRIIEVQHHHELLRYILVNLGLTRDIRTLSKMLIALQMTTDKESLVTFLHALHLGTDVNSLADILLKSAYDFVSSGRNIQSFSDIDEHFDYTGYDQQTSHLVPQSQGKVHSQKWREEQHKQIVGSLEFVIKMEGPLDNILDNVAAQVREKIEQVFNEKVKIGELEGYDVKEDKQELYEEIYADVVEQVKEAYENSQEE